MNDGSTRRQLLQRGAALSAASTIPALLLAAPALASDETDALSDLVALEQASELMYSVIATSSKIKGKTKTLAKTIQGQEAEHVKAFSEALDQLGESAPDEPKNASDAPALRGFKEDGSAKELLDFAISLEEKLVQQYLDSSVDLETGDVIRSGSQVCANHAQHLALLRDLRAGGNGLPGSIEIPKANPPAASSTSSGDSTSSSSK